MERGLASLPDWRDAGAYAPLLEADRATLAWEWLRRDPLYRLAAAKSSHGGAAARRFGLHRFENADRAAPAARPMWTAAASDAVLAAMVIRAVGGHGMDLSALGGLVTLLAEPRAAHLLISDGLHGVRLDLARWSARDECFSLEFTVPGPPALTPQLRALRQLEFVLQAGRLRKALSRAEPRMHRHLLVLRAADALTAGARQREIAVELITPMARQPQWRAAIPHARLQAQRLVRDARTFQSGGYRKLLRDC